MSETASTAPRERLAAFVGVWALEAVPPGGPPWEGGGQTTFEWMDAAPLLIARTHIELPEAPDSVAVIGCDGMGDAYYQLYTDDRDVQRLYAMSLSDDGEWRLERDGEPFSQRYVGRFSEDRREIRGAWEMAQSAGDWHTDFELNYRKIG